jgi:hypothetical protein
MEGKICYGLYLASSAIIGFCIGTLLWHPPTELLAALLIIAVGINIAGYVQFFIILPGRRR